MIRHLNKLEKLKVLADSVADFKGEISSEDYVLDVARSLSLSFLFLLPFSVFCFSLGAPLLSALSLSSNASIYPLATAAD